MKTQISIFIGIGAVEHDLLARFAAKEMDRKCLQACHTLMGLIIYMSPGSSSPAKSLGHLTILFFLSYFEMQKGQILEAHNGWYLCWDEKEKLIFGLFSKRTYF